MLEVTRRNVIEARERIAPYVEQTPLLETRIAGEAVWLKCECLQTGGAFKLRGATNRLLQLDEAQRARGVVAFSSGNHAQGVAIAAQRLGIPAIIVMPRDAPRVKVEGTLSHGAQIHFYDRLRESREEIAAEIAGTRGSIVVPSFDDPHIVAGQGTAGLEIAEQLGEQPRRIVTPAGGGGLAAGLALACEEAEIVCVEPDGWDDLGRSLGAGRIVSVADDAPPTRLDAIQTLRISELTFGILRGRRATAAAVSDEEAFEAIRFAWAEHRLKVEPGGAAGLAALLSGKVPAEAGTVVMLSGANIDPELHERIVATPHGAARPG